MRDYLRRPDIDHLDRQGLEQEAADKTFLSKERLVQCLEEEREAAQTRLAASWLLQQWGEQLPVRLAEVDGKGNISLCVIEERLPPKEVENLGDGINLELMAIPGGKFWMGSLEGEEGAYGDERPRHEVEMSSFLMGKYPITQVQWRTVASLAKVKRELSLDPSNIKGDHHPVESVNWYEAVEFCARLSRHSQQNGQGYQYRLPTEAEWEYACRAGTETRYHFGQTIPAALANTIQTTRSRTTPVGRFQVANCFGLYDMHGNVWEWCADHWHENYQGAPTDGSAWLTEDENARRLLRGGSWISCSGGLSLGGPPQHQPRRPQQPYRFSGCVRRRQNS